MAKKNESVAVEEVKVTVHLDRDPNDPRNRAETPKLPSLNDADQN